MAIRGLAVELQSSGYRDVFVSYGQNPQNKMGTLSMTYGYSGNQDCLTATTRQITVQEKIEGWLDDVFTELKGIF